MTKAAICAHCWDIVSPYRNWQTDRRWRWCECEHAAVRWRDGTQGLLEITAQHGPDYVRVLGVNNGFLRMSFDLLDKMMTDEWWRDCHAMSTERVASNYLFHRDRRACWALLTKPGETGDVFWIEPAPVWAEYLAQQRSVDVDAGRVPEAGGK